MAARSGREFLIKKAGTALAGFKTNTTAFTAEGVDITDKLDSGYRTYADFPGVISFEISGDGVTKDTVLRDLFKAGNGFLLTDVTIQWDDDEEWSCNVFFSAYEETGGHDGSVDFSATFQSSGAWAEVV
jgi:predicted secreted protein